MPLNSDQIVEFHKAVARKSADTRARYKANPTAKAESTFDKALIELLKLAPEKQSICVKKWIARLQEAVERAE